MITSHNDSLVQPESCRLLTLSVPEEFHVPVVFPSRRIPGAGSGVMGQMRRPDLSVHISLGVLWASSRPSSAALWHELLCVCYHEFGHVATFWAQGYVSVGEYVVCGDGCRRAERAEGLVLMPKSSLRSLVIANNCGCTRSTRRIRQLLRSTLTTNAWCVATETSSADLRACSSGGLVVVQVPNPRVLSLVLAVGSPSILPRKENLQSIPGRTRSTGWWVFCV